MKTLRIPGKTATMKVILLAAVMGFPAFAAAHEDDKSLAAAGAETSAAVERLKHYAATAVEAIAYVAPANETSVSFGADCSFTAVLHISCRIESSLAYRAPVNEAITESG